MTNISAVEVHSVAIAAFTLSEFEMRRRLNIKLLAGLIVGMMGFLVGVYLLHGWQVERNADGLRRRADVAKESGDLEESIRLRRRYLVHRPDDKAEFKKIALESKTHLFDMVAQRKTPKSKDLQTTIYLMDEATQKNPKDAELRREGADLWFAMKRYNDAINNLEVIEEEWTEDDQVRYIECLRLSGGPAEEERAINKLSTLIGLNPNDGTFTDGAEYAQKLDAYQQLILLLINARNDRDLAARVVDRMVEVNQDNPQAYLYRSRLIRFIKGSDGADEAKRMIELAYEKAPEDIEVLASYAQALMQEDQEQAKTLLEKALSKADSIEVKSRLYNLLARVYITAADNAGAMKLLNDAIKVVPNDRDLLWTKARLHLDAREYDDVESLYKPMEDANQPAYRVAYLQARILMANGDYLNSTKTLARIRELASGDTMLQYDIDVYLSMGYGATKQLDLRLESLKRMLAVNSGNINAHEQMIGTLVALGRNGEAITYTDNLISQLESNNIAVSEKLRGLRLQLKMTRNLAESTTSISDSDMKSIQSDLRDIYRNKDIPAEQRHRLAIDYFRKVGDKVRAKKAVQTALKELPDSFTFRALSIDYAENEQEAREAYANMEAAMDKERYEYLMRPMLAKIAMKYAPDTAQDVITQQEQAVDHFTDQQKSALYYELGRLQLLFRKNRTDGIRLMELASKHDPKRIDILETLLADATEEGDVARINDVMRRMFAITGPDDDTYRLSEARRIVWMLQNDKVPASDQQGSIGRARELLQQVRSNRPQHIPAFILAANVQQLSGDPASAIQTLEAAHKLQPANAGIIRMIVGVHRYLGNTREVDEWLEKMPLKLRSEGDKRVALSTLWSKKSTWSAAETQEAIALADEIAPEDSTKVKDWLLRSQVYMQAKQWPGAEAAANRARELESANPEVWTNLVTLFVSQDKKAEALEVIQEAEGELAEGVKPIVLGRCHAILKNYSLAEANLLAALQADPKNVTIKRLLAEVYIVKKDTQKSAVLVGQILKEADPEKELDQLQWSRRQMARILSGTDSYSAFQKALELVEQNGADGKLGNKDLALWVFLCYVRPEKSSWDRAIIRLEQVEKTRPLNDDELFMKAQLFEKYGDQAHWLQAKAMAMDVLGRNPGNPKVIESYVKWLLRRGEVNEARSVAQSSLEQTDAIRLLVELHSYAKAGNHQRAANEIQRRTPKIESGSEPTRADLSTLLTLALMAEELGQYNEQFYRLSESMLARLANAEPTEVLRLATAMGVHGDINKIKKGLELCMTANKRGVADAYRTGVAIAILREHPEKWDNELASTMNTIGDWLTQLANEKKRDLAVQWRLGEFHDMTGNLDRAISEYEKLLANDEFVNPYERGMVLNNLAYVMALAKKRDRPVELVREAETLLGPTADLIDTEGFVRYVRGELDQAVERFEEAIRSGTETSHKLFHLALALDKKGQTDTAREKWQRAAELGLSRYQLPIALHEDFERMQTTYGNVEEL